MESVEYAMEDGRVLAETRRGPRQGGCSHSGSTWMVAGGGKAAEEGRCEELAAAEAGRCEDPWGRSMGIPWEFARKAESLPSPMDKAPRQFLCPLKSERLSYISVVLSWETCPLD